MKTSYLPWIGGAMLGIAGLALIHAYSSQSGTAQDSGTRRGDASTDAATHDDPELRRMQADLASLQSQMSAVGNRVAASSPARQPMADLRRQVAADEQRHAAYVATLQASFGLEKVDPRWSSNATTRLWDAINRADALRGAARSVECRASTCRIEIDDDGSGDLNKSLPLWSQQFTDVLPRMVGQTITLQNGQTELVLYLMAPEPARLPAPKG
jgi:hypothetical protein